VQYGGRHEPPSHPRTARQTARPRSRACLVQGRARRLLLRLDGPRRCLRARAAVRIGPVCGQPRGGRARRPAQPPAGRLFEPASAPLEDFCPALPSCLRACGLLQLSSLRAPIAQGAAAPGVGEAAGAGRADRPAAKPRRACPRPASPRCRPATRCWRGPCSSCSSCSGCSASGPDIGWGIFIPYTLYLPYPNPAHMQAGDPPLLARTMQQLLSLLRVFSSGP